MMIFNSLKLGIRGFKSMLRFSRILMHSVACEQKTTGVQVDEFGVYKNECGECKKVKRFTWHNSNNVTIQAIEWGASITSIKVPDKDGKIEDIALGYDCIEDYVVNSMFFGCTMGRVANRIARGKMTVEGEQHQLTINENKNHLHGGVKGFSRVLWNSYVKENKVFMTYFSPEKEEGYPGEVIATIGFELKDNNDFEVDYRAVVSKPCPINMTNHAYFNLAGHGSGCKELCKHVVTINADKITEVTTDQIPTVSGTDYDLRVPTVIGDVVNKIPPTGFDNNYCITKASSETLAFVAKVHHPPSGRVMEVYSDQPGVQFYTTNNIFEGGNRGKGVVYEKHSAVCFETQNFPNAVNIPHFPKVIYYPGEEYRHLCIFRFLVQKC